MLLLLRDIQWGSVGIAIVIMAVLAVVFALLIVIVGKIDVIVVAGCHSNLLASFDQFHQNPGHLCTVFREIGVAVAFCFQGFAGNDIVFILQLGFLLH